MGPVNQGAILSKKTKITKKIILMFIYPCSGAGPAIQNCHSGSLCRQSLDAASLPVDISEQNPCRFIQIIAESYQSTTVSRHDDYPLFIHLRGSEYP